MFYSIVYLLFPIWMFYHKREFHNKKTELNNKIDHFGKDSSCTIDLLSNSPNITHNKIFVFKNKSDGFDFTKNQSNDESKTLQNIFNNFRKLKLLRVLQSTSVSEIEKLKYAEEVLSENAVDNSKKNEKTNDFWETYEDMFF
jgi:hypothetical protein